MLPPGISVFNHKAHHEVLRLFLRIEILEQESIPIDLEFADLVVTPILEIPDQDRNVWTGQSLLREQTL